MSKYTGGYAFPASDFIVDQAKITEEGYQRIGNVRGITLRDYFTGQALTAISWLPRSHKDYEEVATRCYTFADAMLKERTT